MKGKKTFSIGNGCCLVVKIADQVCYLVFLLLISHFSSKLRGEATLQVSMGKKPETLANKNFSGYLEQVGDNHRFGKIHTFIGPVFYYCYLVGTTKLKKLFSSVCFGGEE